jgi:hypothetical protein
LFLFPCVTLEFSFSLWRFLVGFLVFFIIFRFLHHPSFPSSFFISVMLFFVCFLFSGFFLGHWRGIKGGKKVVQVNLFADFVLLSSVLKFFLSVFPKARGNEACARNLCESFFH